MYLESAVQLNIVAIDLALETHLSNTVVTTSERKISREASSESLLTKVICRVQSLYWIRRRLTKAEKAMIQRSEKA